MRNADRTLFIRSVQIKATFHNSLIDLGLMKHSFILATIHECITTSRSTVSDAGKCSSVFFVEKEG